MMTDFYVSVSFLVSIILSAGEYKQIMIAWKSNPILFLFSYALVTELYNSHSQYNHTLPSAPSLAYSA